MDTPQTKNDLFVRHIALPQDHGSWVFLFSPLLIGLFAGGSWSLASVFLIIAALAGFLIRQPITMALKAYSGRRSRRDLPAARFWIVVYTIIGLLGVAGLAVQGYAYLLYLALPGIPVFAWHLYLVSKRAERRQAGVEVVASGVLALAAPAGYWIGVGSMAPLGWLLFILAWLQSAASIVYAYLRLEQRLLPAAPERSEGLRMAGRALAYTSFNLLFAIGLGLARLVSPWLWIPYAVQWVETLWGAFNPCIGWKPTAVGFRQLAVSSLFTVLFILAWGLG